ncbi:small multi-drug export protein [Candidatus Poseidoniaceae archaeon]|nr:small multi-drug export protein [Candidatus Poseidoniaceae archaeon]
MGKSASGGDMPKESLDPETKIRDKTAKELGSIRRRRTNDNKSFLSSKEDLVLFGGIVYAGIFGLLLFAMSSGMVGNTTSIDHQASTTFLDIGDECEEITEEPWMHIFPDTDRELFSIAGHNLPLGTAVLNYTILEIHTESEIVVSSEETTRAVAGEGETAAGRASHRATYSELEAGHYNLILRIAVYNDSDLQNATIVEGGEQISKEIMFEIEEKEKAFDFLPFVSSETIRDIRITDQGARSCWGVQDLGDWGYLLMGAELGGGRETAMLTGGSAGIPAWWMAFVSLSLSVVSLMVLYPITYKVYHQEADDMLSRSHIARLVEDTITNTATRLQIDIDWELYKIEPRELSIDIMVPYKNTDGTFSDNRDVRAEVLKEILDEFAIFRVFKPVQLTVRTIGGGHDIDFDSGVGVGSAGMDSEQSEQDYTSFFSELHTLSVVEDEVRDSLDLFFTRRSDVNLEGAVVTSDDRVIFVSVIYYPTQRFAFFRFKKTTDQIQDELYQYISQRNADLLGSQELIIKTRNQVSTLADRSGAGRIEQSGSDDERVVAIAKQDGLGGKMLQTKFIGNALSTVEYMANEKRDFINRWGFWGLIAFVWIPFMASGVLVGAMLGLLSRMNFTRVLLATGLGGVAASVTWAYTAEGIVKVMHQYKLEAVIPLVIIVFILLTVFHMRSTKMRRQTELFEDTLLDNFHADVQAKYGEN